jgi:diguanylate cyclase (GGDEF)-like protein
MLVVPIVAQGRFYGAMTVAVTERPARLRRAGLGESLAGVVALAATAFDNARLIETIAHQARHDNLTGLLGHRAFHEAIDEPRDVAGTLAMIDLDDFKTINDTYGHPVGDAALRLVAEALRAAVRDGDAVYRVGGEEFAVLLPGLTAAEARPVADRLRLAVSAAPFRVPLRISVGLASGDGDGLVDRADAALYAAKRGGKDRVAIT